MTVTETDIHYLYTSYARALLKATIRTYLKMLDHVPLPKKAAVYGRVFGRVTEYNAMQLWFKGWFTDRAVYDDTGSMFKNIKAPRQDPYFVTDVQPHHKAMGQVCKECDTRKPKTTEYFKLEHNEWSTVCRACAPAYRRCTECGKEKKRIAFHWHRDPNARDGFHVICRECRNAERRQHYARERAA